MVSGRMVYLNFGQYDLMTTNAIQRIFFTLIMSACMYSGLAQHIRTAKNFPGLLAGIEWNTISGSGGIEYERFLYTKNKVAIGARAAYVFPYKYGNMQILGAPCCGSASQILLSGTGSYYTGKKRDFTGFFLHSALGAGLLHVEDKNQAYSNERISLRPLFEIGPGLQFNLGNSIVIRGRASAAFGPFEGSFTYTAVSIGF